MKCKIFIAYPFRNEPWGGGNQFLTALRKELQLKGCYAKYLDDATTVIINSHHFLPFSKTGLQILFKRFARKPLTILHRIDGPIELTRGDDFLTDKSIRLINHNVADVTIFQSEWSKRENLKRGIGTATKNIVILNAADQNLFFPKTDKHGHVISGRKTKIICVSWSSNPRKGFDYYQYLDENLDYSNFQVLFVGNSRVDFQNIENLGPLSVAELAKKMRENDLYLTASKDDPCSNSVLEALASGLPVVYLNSGGHPELVRSGGHPFDEANSMLDAIDNVKKDYAKYISDIPKHNLASVASRYFEASNNYGVRRKISGWAFLILYFSTGVRILMLHVLQKIKTKLVPKSL